MQDISNKLEDFYKWKETTTGLQKVKVKDYLTSHLSPLLSEISSIAAGLFPLFYLFLFFYILPFFFYQR